jgi:hypothetical protein
MPETIPPAAPEPPPGPTNVSQPAPPAPFLKDWLRVRPEQAGVATNVEIYDEACSKAARPLAALRAVVLDHHVGLDVIAEMGGYEKSLEVIKNRAPVSKQIRSGDLGEILAAEYVDQATEFRVPLKRLRYRDDRAVAMRGDDIIGVRLDPNGAHGILKGESKSRTKLDTSVVGQAGESLCRDKGRPKPATLAFTSTILRREKRHELAEVIERFQTGHISEEAIAHLIFVFCGNDPTKHLHEHRLSPLPRIRRMLTAVVIDDHAALIEAIYGALLYKPSISPTPGPRGG